MKWMRENRSYVLFIVFFLLGGIFYYLNSSIPIIASLYFCFNLLIYTGLILFWIQSLRQRLLPSRGRRHLLASALFMFLFLILRSFKYRIIADDSTIGRYTWYAYYIPLLMIPTLFLMSCISFNGPRKRTGISDERLCLLPALVLLLLIFTNDLHHLAFIPKPGMAYLSSVAGTYGHGLVYYLAFGWITLAILTGIIYLAHSARRVQNWKRTLPAILYLALIPVLLSLVNFQERYHYRPMFKMPECIIFCLIGCFESCVRNRLLPYNENYLGFFHGMSLPLLITDRSFSPVHRTQGAVNASPQQLNSALTAPLYLDPDTRLFGMPIRAGYAFWTEDERELHRMNEQLQDANETLALENDLIRQENELREQRAQVESRIRIYTRIAEELYPAQKRIESLLESARPDTEGFRHAMAICCVLNAYVKRRSNLILLSHESSEADSRELFLALDESARYLSFCGVTAAALGYADTRLPIKNMCDLYDAFEALIETFLPFMRRLTVSLSEHGIKLVLESTECPPLPDAALPVSMENSDGFLYLTVSAQEGGAA